MDIGNYATLIFEVSGCFARTCQHIILQTEVRRNYWHTEKIEREYV